MKVYLGLDNTPILNGEYKRLIWYRCRITKL